MTRALPRAHALLLAPSISPFPRALASSSVLRSRPLSVCVRELEYLIECPVAELVVLLQSDDGPLCLVGVEGGRVHSLIWGHNI
jgi:hypothetical protein